MRQSRGEKIFNVFNVTGMVLFAIVCIYPFIYVTALSFNNGSDAARGGIYLFPRVFTVENYITIFKDQRIVGSFLISVYRTVTAALLSVLFNSCCAYAISKRDLPGRTFFGWFIMIPMYFSAGWIPLFIVVKSVGLINNLLVYVIPSVAVPFNILLLRVYYLGMSESLEEAAAIEGAGYFTIFFKIYFPLSVSALATVALLTGIAHWNDWIDGTLFVNNSKLWPMQTLLLNIIQGADIISFLKNSNISVGNRKPVITPESLKMAMLVITVAPIVMVYPFLQRYFIKGMMIGSIKG